jgi:hypothetical protein
MYLRALRMFCGFTTGKIVFWKSIGAALVSFFDEAYYSCDNKLTTYHYTLTFSQLYLTINPTTPTASFVTIRLATTWRAQWERMSAIEWA